MIKKFSPILLVILGSAIFLSAVSHPLHLSVTTIEVKENIITVDVKIFKDDIPLTSSVKNAETYIKQHLQVAVNGKKNSLTLDNAETDSDALRQSFSINNNSKVKRITVLNNILTEVFPDQTNLVIIRKDDTEKGFSLDGKDQLIDFEF